MHETPLPDLLVHVDKVLGYGSDLLMYVLEQVFSYFL